MNVIKVVFNVNVDSVVLRQLHCIKEKPLLLCTIRGREHSNKDN